MQQAKLVLLGDMGAGKSSLVLRFVKGQFFDYQVTRCLFSLCAPLLRCALPFIIGTLAVVWSDFYNFFYFSSTRSPLLVPLSSLRPSLYQARRSSLRSGRLEIRHSGIVEEELQGVLHAQGCVSISSPRFLVSLCSYG